MISLEIRSGHDKYYVHNNGPNTVQMFSGMTLGREGIQFLPQFNNDKTVAWEKDEIRYSEDEIVNKFYALLLEAMSKEND